MGRLSVDDEEADGFFEAAQDREGDVVDGHAAARGAAQVAAMGMAVDRERRAELIEGTGEARRAEEREDLEGLALERRAAGRVMKQGDPSARAELEERVLELQLLGDAGVDELLHDRFAEALQLRVLESAGESLDARDAQFLAERDGLPVEHLDPDLGELLPDDLLLPRLVVMVAEDGDAWKVEATQLLGQPGCFLGSPVVSEVPGEQQAIRLAVDSVERRGNRWSRVGPAVQIADGCDPHVPPSLLPRPNGLTGQRVSPSHPSTSNSRASP